MKTKPKRTAVPVRLGRKTSRKNETSPSKKLAGKDFERTVEQFQDEPDDRKAHERWKHIETSIFGVQFED